MFGWLKGRKKQEGASAAVVSHAAQFLVESLRTQMGLMDGVERGLPAVAKDGFSLGYLAGYSEAVAQMRRIDSDAHGYVVQQAVFTDIFGPQEGPLLFAQFMTRQEQGDEEIALGMKFGGEDLFAWLNGEIEEPRKWAEYVNRN